MGDSIQTGRSNKLHYYSAEKPFYNSHNRVLEVSVAAHKSCRTIFVGCLYSRSAVLIGAFYLLGKTEPNILIHNVDTRQ